MPPKSRPTEEQQSMDIHKPKPIRNWRELLKEVGIIVLGVCIALGAEQTVEWVHWQGEVRAARGALQAEIAADNLNMFAFRVAIGPCVDKQLNQAEAILTALDAGAGPTKIPRLQPFPPPAGLIRDDEWQSERASQVLTHFPRAELALMSRYYGQFEDFSNWRAQENGAWPELSVLQTSITGITKSDLLRLRVNLDIAQHMEYVFVLNAKRQLTISRQLGIADEPQPERVKNYCTMSETEYRHYRATKDLR
jgi:hypothetical protein